MPEWFWAIWSSAPFWRNLFFLGILPAAGVIFWLRHITRQLESKTRELAEAAVVDHLTGLANRRAHDAFLNERLPMAQRDGSPISVLVVDLDRLKAINDSMGHPSGDQAIVAIAKVLARVVIRETDLAARYGGDEFSILSYGCTQEGARRIAREIIEAVRALPAHGEHHLTVSIGALTYNPSRGIDSEAGELVQSADRALYQAKRAGRDQAYFVSEGTPRT